MLKVEFVGADSAMKSLQQQIVSETAKLAQTVFNEVRSRTPVDTGRARSGWSKQTKPNGFVVQNDVPYVPVLDRGRHMTPRGMRGSKQAPKGIVGPSLTSIKGKN
jgi:hypothetical protein